VLKEKLKVIKGSLMEWHLTHTNNLLGRMDSLKEHISSLDKKGEESLLSTEEVEELHDLTSDLHSLSSL